MKPADMNVSVCALTWKGSDALPDLPWLRLTLETPQKQCRCVGVNTLCAYSETVCLEASLV